MKTRVLPAPKGTPARIPQTGWMVVGRLVQENQSWPRGARMAAMQMTETEASGARTPVVLLR